MAKKERSAKTELLALIERLPEPALSSLAEFAGFLADKYPFEPEQVTVNPIPRPETEGIIAAIKRLTKTYPMLDKKVVFDQTALAMSDHVLEDQDATHSIDRLERIFREAYEAYCLKTDTK